jgi:DNA-binding CsgD family transcriptional regulator
VAETREARSTTVLAAVRRIAAIDELRQFGAGVMGELHRLIDFDHGIFNEVDPVTRLARFDVYPPGMPAPEWGFETYERLLPRNPIFKDVQQKGDGSARRLSDFVDQARLQTLPFYTELLEPLGMRYQVAFSLAYRRPQIVAFSLNRSQYDFTDDEVAVLDLVRPHLSRVYRRLRQSTEPLRRDKNTLATIGRSWRLTPRETEVLKAATHGLEIDAIAARLGISTRTVDKHLQHVYRKLGVTNRAAATAAAAAAIRRGDG